MSTRVDLRKGILRLARLLNRAIHTVQTQGILIPNFILQYQLEKKPGTTKKSLVMSSTSRSH